jgi:glucose dehydrogenase
MRNQRDDSKQGRVHGVPSRREALIAGAAMITAPFLGGVTSAVQAAQAVGRPADAQAGKVRATTEWLSYGNDKASSKYSPLTQISANNFSRLKVAWTWRSAEETVAKANHLKTWAWESTPLMVGGVLYVSTSLSQVAAIDAVTGKTRWVYDPETWKNGTPSNNGFVHRGVAYWADGKPATAT